MTTTPDASGHGHPGTLLGTPNPAVVGSPWAGFDNAFDFAGTGGCGVDCGPWDGVGPAAVSGVGSAAACTLEARVQLGVATAGGAICGWFNTDQPPQLYVDGSGHAQIYWTDNTNTGQLISDPTATLGDVAPHVVAADYDGTTMRLYVDGVVVVSLATTGIYPYASGDNFWIGNDDQGDTLEATIDEVRWSKVARYAGVYTPAAAPFTTDANTLALYHLDSGPPTVTRLTALDDASGLNYQFVTADSASDVWVTLNPPDPAGPDYGINTAVRRYRPSIPDVTDFGVQAIIDFPHDGYTNAQAGIYCDAFNEVILPMLTLQRNVSPSETNILTSSDQWATDLGAWTSPEPSLWSWEAFHATLLQNTGYPPVVGLLTDDSTFDSSIGSWTAGGAQASVGHGTSPPPVAGTGVLNVEFVDSTPSSSFAAAQLIGTCYGAAAGDVITVSMWVRSDPANAGSVHLYTADLSADIPTGPITGSASFSSGAWVQVTATGTAGADGAVTIFLSIATSDVITPITLGDFFYVSDVTANVRYGTVPVSFSAHLPAAYSATVLGQKLRGQVSVDFNYGTSACNFTGNVTLDLLANSGSGEVVVATTTVAVTPATPFPTLDTPYAVSAPLTVYGLQLTVSGNTDFSDINLADIINVALLELTPIEPDLSWFLRLTSAAVAKRIASTWNYYGYPLPVSTPTNIADGPLNVSLAAEVDNGTAMSVDGSTLYFIDDGDQNASVTANLVRVLKTCAAFFIIGEIRMIP